MTTDIKERCPFCGSQELKHYGYGNPEEPDYYVQCGACTTTGPFGWSKEEAIAAWNRRTPVEQSAQTAEPPKNQQISCDVSTGDCDAHHRIFARLTGESFGLSKGGRVWLAEEVSRNFDGKTERQDSNKEKP